ncbi:MAG: M14-type cytosolic carboxypeptidase [Candidatus Sericytochromatia bacterium]
MKISSNFDSGNIDIVDDSDINNIQLKIQKDSNSDFFQWFHFRLQGEAGKEYTMKIINAHESSYVDGWKNYNACASYDRKEWFRVPTEFDGTNLIIKHKLEHDNVYYAYFTPYSYERHLDLIGFAQKSPICKVSDLGDSVDGHDISLLSIGTNPENKKIFWVIARQHPGESMAEWFIEGMLERLLDENDKTSKSLLEKAFFYVVPNMNPDGSMSGNLRSNSAGANLNREWQTPSIERSPEVYYVREKVHQTGVDLFLDVHGDEAIPYNFIAACEGNPNYNDRIKNLEDKFLNDFIEANPAFQNVHGYEKDKFGEANLTLATNYMGETFDCLSMTLEMPFKDDDNNPDKKYGWSSDKSKKLGASVLAPMLKIVEQLR